MPSLLVGSRNAGARRAGRVQAAVEPVAVLLPQSRIGVDEERIGVVLPMVFAEVGLERRPAVAKQVVTAAKRGRVVRPPLDQTVLRREEPRRREPAGGALVSSMPAANHSTRNPGFSVSRLIVHESCTKNAASYSTMPGGVRAAC